VSHFSARSLEVFQIASILIGTLGLSQDNGSVAGTWVASRLITAHTQNGHLI
jgi:hypothetical protein